jgi:lysophospholipase L1-like esterase
MRINNGGSRAVKRLDREAQLDFATRLAEAGACSLTVFGDSITVGVAASRPELAWPQRFARGAGLGEVRNHAISGTVLQGSLLADGRPRPDNGISRYRVLLEPAPAHAVAILYGYNDARYTVAPATMNPENFRRDYEVLLQALADSSYAGRIAIGSPPFIPTRGFGVGSAGFTGQTRAGFEAYVDVVRELAQKFGVFYAPVYEAMREHGDGALASPDITHPNDAGHAAIAAAFLGARVP